MFNECPYICARDTLAVFDKFLVEVYKVNLQIFYVNELTKWFVF